VTRRLSVWLAGAAVLATVLALVGCVVATTVGPVKAAAHPGYPAGIACDAPGCHDTYKHKQPYMGPCEDCHTLNSWTPAVYSHKDKSFDNGMHPNIGCVMCHTEGEPLPPRECRNCHEAPHGGLKACVNCHTTNAWGMRKPLPETHVSLLGGHAKLECFDCHKDAKATAKPRQCTNCHGTNHGGLTNCQDCHDPSTGWNPKEGWNHDTFFVRVGQHAKLDCNQCHKGGRFAGTPKVCVGCHGKQHGGLTDCSSCHTPLASAGFAYTKFRHSSVFPLTGQHTKIGCTSATGAHTCHVTGTAHGEFAKVRGNGSHACVDCHGAHHGGLTDCAACHTTAGFSATTFRHTGFPLTGRHTTLRCDQCHPGGEFTPKPSTRCVDCHGEKHGGQTQCQHCHTPAGFHDVPPFTDHPIPLGGTHADTTKCTRCHPTTGPGSGPVFNNTVPPCVTCHAATIPHVGPTDCVRCHWPTSWPDVHFTHSPIYFFPGVEAPHAYNDPIFGPYPTGCAKCHPSSDAVADFTDHNCSNSECH
jgi:hypothetical protein